MTEGEGVELMVVVVVVEDVEEELDRGSGEAHEAGEEEHDDEMVVEDPPATLPSKACTLATMLLIAHTLFADALSSTISAKGG